MSASTMFYLDQEALVADQLALVRMYLDAAEGEAPPSEVMTALEEQIEARTIAALAHGVPMPVAWLRHRLELTASEERVLWVLIGHELYPEARRRLRALAAIDDAGDPSLDVLRRVVYGSRAELRRWRELSPDGALGRNCLIQRIDHDEDAPSHRMTFRVARRVLALVHGDLGLDEELEGIAERAAESMTLGELEVDPSVRDRVREHAMRGTGLAVLHGRAGSGRRSLWIAAAHAAGREVLVIDARRLAREREVTERQLRVAARECRLLGMVPLLLHADALGPSAEASDRLDLIESELGNLILATAAGRLSRRWRRPPVSIELPTLPADARARLWRRALPTTGPGDADLLAAVYPLAPALIRTVGEVAVREAAGAEMQAKHVEAGIRAVLDDRLAGLATRVGVTQTWDDLVLPADQRTQLTELLARIREGRRVYEDWGFAAKLGRPLGVSALFSGPPGTGKTMCAGLIARELGTELYQVDPAQVMSRWIGETETQLATLFDAAEAGHAILLFDEADALFGRRTALRASERYANREVEYLRQRLERFSGICILTTCHEASIDGAFRRRLSMHVRFPVPDEAAREKLWRSMLPERAPVSAILGLDELARRYAMSGGYIRNAVLRAAFLAADEDGPITADLLAHAAQLEYEAMGKVVAGRVVTAARVLQESPA